MKKSCFFKIVFLFLILVRTEKVKSCDYSPQKETNQSDDFQVVLKRPRHKKNFPLKGYFPSTFDIKTPETLTDIDLASSLRNFSGLYKKNFLMKISNLAINLKFFSLESNNLNALPFCIGKLYNLESLNLCHNNLKSLPPSIKKLTSLTFLDLSKNNFFLFPKSIFCLKNLEHLNISGNNLTELPPCLNKNFVLRILDLSFNFLTSFPFSWKNFEELSSLDLSYNHLRKVPPVLQKIQRRRGKKIEINLSNKSMGKLPKICTETNPLTRSSITTSLALPSYSHDLLLQGIYYAHQHHHVIGENVHILLIECDITKKLIPIHNSLVNNLRPQISSVLPVHAQKVAQIIVSKQDQGLRIPISPGASLGFLNCSLSADQIKTNIERFQNKAGGTLINMSYKNSIYPPELLSFQGLIIKTLGNEGILFSESDPEFYRLMKSSAQFCSHVILVGALDCSGYQTASYTNTPGQDNFIFSRTLLATGGGQGGIPGIPFKVLQSDEITYSSGTSFAAPLVTGALALLQEKFKKNIDSKKITLVDLGNFLLRSADTFGICNSAGLLTTDKAIIGRGRLNLKRAIKMIERSYP